MTTINVTFDPESLPRWVHNLPGPAKRAVIEKARSDLAYRCDVHNASTASYRRSLVALATRGPAMQA